MRRLRIVLWLLFASLSCGVSRAAPPPFVGCPSEGQSGPLPAPTGPLATPVVPKAAARYLADYSSAGLGVLAPRGWHCIAMYGSGGAFLLVTPRRYTADSLPGFNSLIGPAVELSFLNGENSGRDQVALVFSRLFPFKRRFIADVAENDELLGLPRRERIGRMSADRTVRRSRTVVDYTTPAHRGGMGTFSSRLGPGARPIFGRAMLAKSNGVDSVILLNVRLPAGLRGLLPVILASVAHSHAEG